MSDPRTDDDAADLADGARRDTGDGGSAAPSRAGATRAAGAVVEDDPRPGDADPAQASTTVAGGQAADQMTLDAAAGDARPTDDAGVASSDRGAVGATSAGGRTTDDGMAEDARDTGDAGGDGDTGAGATEAGNGTRGDDGDRASGDPGEVVGDDEPGSPWDVLRPLDSDDLAAMDPSALEDDIDLEDDVAAPDDVGESDDPRTPPPSPGPASSRTSEDLTAASVLRTTSRAPRSGWRRMIHRMTGGTVSPGASRSDREREEQLAAIRTLVSHPRRITVLSRKGGVGKTTTTLMLGQTLASERGDRIIAVDGNPDAGNLGYRIDPTGPDATVTDLLNEIDNVHRYADMRRFTTQTRVGLEVLRSDDDPQISTALGDQEYSAILSLLDRFYNLVLIDTGTGILDSAVQGILDGTDQIVLVVSPSLDAARSASQTLDWLSEHGFVGLVENAVAVINQSRRSTMVDVARIEDHFWDRCGATVRIPWDGFLEAGAETELDDLRPATREAYRHLAAAVARRFDT